MRKNREFVALAVGTILGSLLLILGSGTSLFTTLTFLVPAIFVLYFGKYFWNDRDIKIRPVSGFPSIELIYVFLGSQILKILISYVLSDFISLGIADYIIIALELLSIGALSVLLSKLSLKLIPK